MIFEGKEVNNHAQREKEREEQEINVASEKKGKIPLSNQMFIAK